MSIRFMVALALIASAHVQAADLSLDEAIALALTRQPLLQGAQASIDAARENIVPAGQLPDPRLKLGLLGVPTDTFNVKQDSNTLINFAYEQNFPRREKRLLRGQRSSLDVQRGEAELIGAKRTVTRDVTLAWLEAWYQQRTRTLVEEAEAHYRRQIDAATIALRTGKTALHDIVRLKIELDLQKDRAADIEAQAKRARAELARWIGADASRPLALALPAPNKFESLNALRARLHTNPEINVALKDIAIANNEIAQARAARSGDWMLELGYAARPGPFPDLVSVQATWELPIARAQRQDRTLAAKLAEKTKALAEHDDHLRMLNAELEAAFVDWQSSLSRVERFEKIILPQADQRVKAVLAAYQASKTDLASVIDARRAQVELRLQSLALQIAARRAQARLAYLSE